MRGVHLIKLKRVSVVYRIGVSCVLLSLIQGGNLWGQWVRTGGPSMRSVSALSISGATIIAGTSFGDIYVSTDNGANWNGPKYLTLGYVAQIISVPVAGSPGDTAVFAAVYSDTGVGLFVSPDLGNSWQPDGLLGSAVQCLAASGTDLFAGTWSHGIYHSTNMGSTWTASNKGLPASNGANFPTVTSLEVISSGGGTSTIYAGTNAGIFTSTDNGASWDSLGLGNVYVNALAFVTSGGTSILFAGTYDGLMQSTNGGNNWSTPDSGMLGQPIYSIAVSGSAVIAGSDSSLYLSTDNGNSWTQANVGVLYPDVLAAASIGSTFVIGTNSGGIYRSDDAGLNWISLNTDISTYSVTDLLKVGTTIFAATYNGIYISGNAGASWIPASGGLSSDSVTSLASDGANVLAGTLGGIFLSTDNGSSWSQSDSGLTDRRIAALLSVPATDSSGGIYAGTPTGLFVSTNNGFTWTRSDSDLADTLVTTLSAVQLPGSTSPYVYLGTNIGVFYSTTPFGIWNAQSIGLTNSKITAIVASNGYILAGTNGGGVFVSTGYGGSWLQAGDTSLTNASISVLAVTPPLGQSGTVGLFAATSGGVFLSTDFGTTWLDIGMNSYSISSLVISDTTLLAGTAGHGVWRMPISAVLSGIAREPENVPEAFKLFQNYPNPFNPSTAISYQLSTVSKVTLMVYDVLGREVETLVDGKQSPGAHVVSFDGTRFASGVYFYVLRAGANVKVRKMLLLK